MTATDPTRQKLDYAKGITLAVSVLALIVSAFSFWVQYIKEIHDFRAVDFGGGILLINAGNRTEALASARYLYGLPDWRPGKGGQYGEETGPVILKPGEAQVIKLQELPEAKLSEEFRDARHIAIDFLIIDTRTGYSGEKVFLETVVGVNILHKTKGGWRAGPGPLDKAAYANLYKGERVE